MRKPALLIISGLMLGTLQIAQGESSVMQDGRINIGLTTEEKAEFLSEMRQMLVSIQGIVEGIGKNDRQLIVDSARYSGNRMARATPDEVRNRLPQSFKDIGGPTHMMFEELVVRAESDDMQTLIEFTGELMLQCTKCHAIFKIYP